MLQPPLGSKIRADFDGGAEKLFLPNPSTCVMKLFFGFFAIVCAAASVFSIILLSDGHMLAVLAMWGIIDLFIFYMTYQTFKTPVPETIVLSNSGMLYDSGIAPYHWGLGQYSIPEQGKIFFTKRFQCEIKPERLKTLMLCKLPMGDRLTLDTGAKRIEIGRGLADIERAWLYGVIREKYGLERNNQ